jgi:ubiquinone/menaquinone biosynthesis C-methylase UbiE
VSSDLDPAPLRGARPRHDFDAIYADPTPPPWDIGHPQAAFTALAEAGALVGRVLDVGCGTGEHALLAAACGLKAVGVDASSNAIALAERKALDRCLAVRFVVGDALKLDAIGESFDTVVDCGLFHCLDDVERADFCASLASVVPAGGRYHLLCFSERQPGDSGPRRVTERELRDCFERDWMLDVLERAVIEVTTLTDGVEAWRLQGTRR